MVVLLLAGCDRVFELDDVVVRSPVPDASPDAPTTYTAAVLLDAPLAYFRLNETAGVNAYDTVGGAPGTIVGNTMLGQPGALANDPDLAMRFDGLNGAVDLDQRFGFAGTVPYSIECWVRLELDGQSRSIMSKWKQPPLSAGWDLYYSDTMVAITREQMDIASDSIMTPNMIGDGAYHHVVGTFEGTTLSLYIDGRLKASRSPTTAQIPAIVEKMMIGAGNGNAAQQNQVLHGSIDEVAFYDHALTAERVSAHYDAATSP